jgi:hypothetical protein
MRDIRGNKIHSPAQAAEQIMALAEELADACSDYRMYKVDSIEHFNQVRKDLQSAVEELARDAERYRWLRATTNTVTNSKGERIDVRNMPAEWDAAIDAAMKGEQP